MTLLKKHASAVFATILFGIGVQPASGDLFIGSPNPDLSGFLGPYATVNVALNNDGTQATITFTAVDYFLMGGAQAAALNVNGEFAVGPFTAPTGPQLNAKTPKISMEGIRVVDGFGTFDLVLRDLGGFGSATNTLSFTLTKTTGAWTGASDVLTPNDSGYYAAAHIFVANSDWTNSGVTGYATVPDGGMTVSLLGLALVAFGLLLRLVK